MSYFNFDNQNNQDEENYNENDLPAEDYFESEITYIDPEETLENFYTSLLTARSEQEIHNLLEGFQRITEREAVKNYLVDDVQDKMLLLNEIEHGTSED